MKNFVQYLSNATLGAIGIIGTALLLYGADEMAAKPTAFTYEGVALTTLFFALLGVVGLSNALHFLFHDKGKS